MNPIANKNAVVTGDNYRFTVLTDRLIRMEYDESGAFEDRATQTVVNRELPVPHYTVETTADAVVIETDCIRLTYRGGRFAKNNLHAEYCGKMGYQRFDYYYGDDDSRGTLPGTIRTLDGVDGSAPLPPSIMCRRGMTVIDDSESLAMEGDFVEPRRKDILDVYLFAYAGQLCDCLDAYYSITGATPMLPRFALGNWWSKYYAYSEKSYMELMNRFAAEGIPMAVAVIDMDWHKVDIDPKYGCGWTGFSWNTELFPDPRRFLRRLHDMGMKATLNLHPASGISAHEDCYKATAEAMGVDPESEKNIPFDIADKKFVDVYFDKVIKPLEDDGVDFWWMDWQQGNTTKIEGLDPLWMLNHFHYEHARCGGESRGLLFSRFSGYGSHRYPVGFSGDTFVTWDTLDFQPYFTSSAANVGYGWWSHDIGGHLGGVRDDELMSRWTQFGVFSPIMRLHSSKSEFVKREPWSFGADTHSTMRKFMRLRCEMIPYLYTMNRRAHVQGRPLVMPIYYYCPHEDAAWEMKNEYFFGTELIVCPITHPKDAVTNMGSARLYLPEGEWFDFFNKYRYSGDRCITAYRKFDEMPVFAKAGAIIPMSAAETNADSNPDEIVLNIFPGADNSFTLYEDANTDESYLDGRYAETDIEFKWSERKLVIHAPRGDASVIPANRRYKIVLNCVDDCAVIVDKAFEKTYENGSIVISTDGGAAQICFDDSLAVTENDYKAKAYDVLYGATYDNFRKDAVISHIRTKPRECALSDVISSDMPQKLKEALVEVLG